MAFTEVEKMFKLEIEALSEHVKNTLEESVVVLLGKKLTNLRNLCKTMSDLIKNIVTEVENSREEMFKILESIAFVQVDNDSKKFSKEKVNSDKRESNTTSGTTDVTQHLDLGQIISNEKSKKLSNSRSSSSSKSNSSVKNQGLHVAMDFDEEEKKSETSSKSGYNCNKSSTDNSEFEFGIDDEEEIFLDA